MRRDRADIALIGLKIENLVDWHEPQRAADHGADVTPPPERARRLLGEYFAADAERGGTLQGVTQALAAHRF